MTGWYPHVRGHRTFGHLLRAHHGEPNALTLLKRASYHVWWGGKNHLVPAEHGFDAYCDVKFQPGASDYARWGHEPRPFAQATAHRDAVFCEGGRRRGETHAMERGANERPDGLYWPRAGPQVCDDAPYHTKAVMCRTADHKYVHRLYERDELYDLRDDPAELRNLIDDPDRAPLVAELRQRLLTWFLDTADAVPHDLDAVEWSGLFGPTTTAV